MESHAAPPARSAALRLARQAWRLLYGDSQRCITSADAALAMARKRGDHAAQGWSLLTRGFHLIWYDTPGEAASVLDEAQRCFDRCGDHAGRLLAQVGLARAIWRGGEFRRSLDLALSVRDEGLRLLKRDERGMLLNTIAGCYSELGQSQQAFAYMFQALREVSGARSNGFDVMLFCNLGHELIQLGDYLHALSYLEEGLQRCDALHNPRLDSVLRINRVICLYNLGRSAEALADIRRLLQLPTDPFGRGRMNAHFEDMAIAALRAGDTPFANALLERAQAALQMRGVPDEHVTSHVARAELLLAAAEPQAALACLHACAPMRQPAVEGLSLRVRCEYYQTLADVHERLGRTPDALRALRRWQTLHVERALLASGARYQAAALHTELLRMKHALLDSDARRRTTERAKAELQAANEQLKNKVAEVEALQQALRAQATRDFLTGLFNRRHLDDVLPSMLAMARRDRQPLTVVIIDLDHFKTVNDALGHMAGDRMLAAFGALLVEHSRKSDVACRYGGEEFCLLMPRTAAASARRKCAALLRLWSQQQRVPAHGEYTFSAGIADSLLVGGGAPQLLQAADQALLKAKRMGRNRVLVHDVSSRAAA